MTAEEIREYCLTLKGTTESIKWGDHLCFCIAEKMYLVINPDQFPVSSSFKTTSSLFDQLTSRDGIIPAPYMARNLWVHVDDVKRLSKAEWIELSNIAYNLILEKLPAKTKNAIII